MRSQIVRLSLALCAPPTPHPPAAVRAQHARAPEQRRDNNTEASFCDLTRPKVIKQTGAIIAPLQLSKATLAASSDRSGKRAAVMVVSGGAVKRNKKQ